MPEYFINDRVVGKKRTIEDELIDNIVYCITNNNISKTSKQYNKIHTNRKEVSTEMNFKLIEDNEDTYMYFYNIIEKMQYTDIDTGNLSKKYILDSFEKPKNITLFVFDSDTKKEHSVNTLKSILTFFYNDKCDCIEIDVFWSKPGGGGPLFNYLINAVKCALNMTETPHNRKIFLKSLPTDNTTGFYKKYGMIPQDTPHGLIPFTRELSVDSIKNSVDNNRSDEMNTIAIDDDLQWLMDNIDVLKKDVSPKKNTDAPQMKISPPKKSQDSPEYYVDIDKYKEQKVKNKMENRKRVQPTYNLRKYPKKSSVFVKATKAVKEYNKYLNKAKSKTNKSKTSTRNKTLKRK
jgi:hypothetical protein